MNKLVIPLALATNRHVNQLAYKILQIPTLLQSANYNELLNFAKSKKFDQPSYVYDILKSTNVHDESVRNSSSYVVDNADLVKVLDLLFLISSRKVTVNWK